MDEKYDNGLRPLILRAEVLARKFEKLGDVSVEAVQAMDLLGEIREWVDAYYPMLTDVGSSNGFANWTAFLRTKLNSPPKHSGAGKILAVLFNAAPNVAVNKKAANLALAKNLNSGADLPMDKIVDVYICQLRNALRGSELHDIVETVWGVGHRLTPKGRAAVAEWRKEFEERSKK